MVLRRGLTTRHDGHRNVVWHAVASHEILCSVAVAVVGLCVLVGIVRCVRSCRFTQSNNARVVQNYFTACVVAGCMTLLPACLVLGLGASMVPKRETVGLVLFFVGLGCLLVFVGLLGHQSFELDVHAGTVRVIRRWFLLCPYHSTYDVEDVRGFVLRLSFSQGRPQYQLQMLLMDGRSVPLERGKQAANLKKRQALCARLNELLVESRRTHGGYGSFATEPAAKLLDPNDETSSVYTTTTDASETRSRIESFLTDDSRERPPTPVVGSYASAN